MSHNKIDNNQSVNRRIPCLPTGRHPRLGGTSCDK